VGITQLVVIYHLPIGDSTAAPDGSFIVEGTADEDGFASFELRVSSSARIPYSPSDSTTSSFSGYHGHTERDLVAGTNEVGTVRLRPTGLLRVRAILSEPLAPGDVLEVGGAIFHGGDDPPPYELEMLVEGNSEVRVHWELRRQGSMVSTGTRTVDCPRHQLTETLISL
jgi:hypothetical protein